MIYQIGAQAVGTYRPNFKILDGDPQRITLKDETPEIGLITRPGNYAVATGRAVDPEFVPTKVKWLSSQPVPDVDKLHGILVVSDQFKETVEKFEHHHQFLPVQFIAKDSDRVIAERWFFIVCNRLDAVDRDRTTLILRNGVLWVPVTDLPVEERPDWYVEGTQPKLVYSDAKIGAASAWRDKFLINGPFVSAALGDALAKLNLTGIILIPKESY